MFDLSDDSEASVDLPTDLSSNQLLVERVITKVFTQYHCDVVITDRLRSLFTSKLWRMGKALQALGGTGRARQIQKWKDTKWPIELHDKEIIPSNRKRKPDNVLIQSSKPKYAKVESDLKESKKKLKDMTNQVQLLNRSNKKLSLALKANGVSNASTPVRGRGKKKWTQYSSQYQRKKRKQIAQDVRSALSFVADDNFEHTKVELRNSESGEVLTVHNDGRTLVQKQHSPEPQNLVSKTLYIKERYNLSNTAYHELAMVNSSLPRSYALTKAARELDALSIIRPTPGKVHGVQQSLTERLLKHARHLKEANPLFPQGSHIRVKITGDGTVISRSMHAVVIAFTIVEDGANPNSPGGNHTIALLNTGENYTDLLESLEDIRDEIQHLKSLSLDGVQYGVEFFLGADWKYLALIIGIEAANARYSCIWCTCPSEDRHDISKEWSFRDKDKGARTIEDIQRLAALKKRGSVKFGCARQPIFPSIPIDHVIPDVLHLFLRICDVLINLLILELRRLDGIEKSKLQTFDRSKTRHVVKYEEFLNNECKISFHMYLDKEKKTLKWRDLRGPEKIQLLKVVNLPNLFPEINNATKIQEIWVEFREIYGVLRSTTPLSTSEVKTFKSRIWKWLTLFLSVYQTKHVTPYMHLLVSHIPEFLEKYGTISQFSQQGLEKLNDDITKDYFRSTNHRDPDALKQLLLKLNRLEELEGQDCSRSKQVHVCRKCKNAGHNSRTCSRAL